MSSNFKKQLEAHMLGGFVSAAIALGRKLHLFEALAEAGSAEEPASAAQVAQKANCKERYVREWLSALSCGKIIEVTEADLFYMTDEQRKELIGHDNLEVAEMSFLPEILKTFDELSIAFKANSGKNGLKYSQFANFYSVMDDVTQAMHSKHLLKDYFPLIGMTNLLENGITCLDIGCGSGFHALMMAEHFPRSSFMATDISERAIEMALDKQRQHGGLHNLCFVAMDAGKMSPSWSNNYDFITIFDACHDQMRPDLCLKEVYRMLKPNGTFAMLEINGTSSAYEDREKAATFSAAFYTISMFHCLPVGSNRPDALCMGAMWGEKRACKLLVDAGFSAENIQILRPAFFPPNIVYLCKKCL